MPIFTFSAAGGDEIERVVQRLNGNGNGEGKYKDHYHDLWERKYDWAFVFLGHNDTKASSVIDFVEPLIPPNKQRILYEELISKLKGRGIGRIIFISPTSSNYQLCKANSDKNEDIHNRFGEPKHLEAFAAVLQKLVRDHHLEYIDIYTPMQKISAKNELLMQLTEFI